jgi:MerR family transcriptional regulator, repressor of the yfmOP operon
VSEMRIGDVAALVGTTPRTIRYYEEIGLLPAAPERPAGSHRLYGQEEVEHLRELLRMKEVLGVSLDELRELVAAEETRAALKREYHEVDDPVRRREIAEEALGLIDRQLELVRRRRDEVARLEDELTERRALVTKRLREMKRGAAAKR